MQMTKRLSELEWRLQGYKKKGPTEDSILHVKGGAVMFPRFGSFFTPQIDIIEFSTMQYLCDDYTQLLLKSLSCWWKTNHFVSLESH